jgi:hypothetical protein
MLPYPCATYSVDGVEETVPIKRAFVQRGRAVGAPKPEWFLCGTNPLTGGPVAIPLSLRPVLSEWQPPVDHGVR